MVNIPALRIKQKDVTIYVSALPFGELRKYMKVDDWRPDDPDGYQRPLGNRRLSEIAKYITEGKGVLPTSVLLATRVSDEITITFEASSSNGVDGSPELGVISIPDDAVLWVVDGQHRLFGMARAYEKGEIELASYPFPFTVIVGVDRYEEMTHFNIINTMQKKMPTDIVDRHLVQKAEREGIDLIAQGPKGAKEYLRAMATRIVDKLNEAPGPWHDQIAIPGVVGRDNGLVRQHAMVVSLEPALKDSFLAARDEGEVVKLLTSYWRALEKVWPEAFASPDEYRVQATVGIYSLNSVFPSVVQLCLAERDFSEEKMREIWEGTGIETGFWSKGPEGDNLTLGTGMASIRALAEYLRRELPAGSAVTI